MTRGEAIVGQSPRERRVSTRARAALASLVVVGLGLIAATAAPAARALDCSDPRAGRLIAHERLPADRFDAEVLVRGLRRACRADPAGGAGGCVRVRQYVAAECPLRTGAGREAGRVHDQQARARRAEVEPGRDQDRVRSPPAGDQAARRYTDRSDRRLHAHDPPQPRTHERALECRQPGDRRALDPEQGRAR